MIAGKMGRMAAITTSKSQPRIVISFFQKPTKSHVLISKRIQMIIMDPLIGAGFSIMKRCIQCDRFLEQTIYFPIGRNAHSWKL